jgi:hypothetical protein
VITPIEGRILKSILRIIQLSAVKLEDVPQKHQDWAINMRERIKDRMGRETDVMTSRP